MVAFVRYLIPFCAALLWIGMLAPGILRIFGVPMISGFWRLDRLNQHLSKLQYVWGYGVFSFGIGMFMLSALMDYPKWGRTYERTPATVSDIALRLLIWLAAGGFVGSLSRPRLKDSTSGVGNKPWNR